MKQDEWRSVEEFSEDLVKGVVKETISLLMKGEISSVLRRRQGSKKSCYDFENLYYARRIFITSTSPFEYYFVDESDSRFDDVSPTISEKQKEDDEIEEMIKEIEGISEGNSEILKEFLRFGSIECDFEVDPKFVEIALQSADEVEIILEEEKETVEFTMERMDGERKEEEDVIKVLRKEIEKMVCDYTVNAEREGNQLEEDDGSAGVSNEGYQESEEEIQRVENRQSGQNQPPVCVKKWKCSWTESISTSLSIISLAGSLGNVLRLPRMVYFHGGGVFLLVYILITLLFGLPLTFLEIGLGQFCQHGTIKFWRAVNLFRGVGYATVVLSFIASVYYSVYMASAFSMLAWSARGQVPFPECTFSTGNTSSDSHVSSGATCLQQTFLAPVSQDAVWFGLNTVFLFILWVLVMSCMVKKSHSFRRAMCVIFPLLVALLIALLVEASSRTTKGLGKLFNFEWSRLASVEVWYFSFVEMMFSLHLGFGNISTCAGRIYPKSNAFWTAFSATLVNLLIGLSTVCLVYLWLGQLEQAGVRPPQSHPLFVMQVLYDVAVHCMERLKEVWLGLGALLLICAALISVVVLVYTVLVAVAIETRRKWHWWQVAGVLSLAGFVLGMLAFIPPHLSIPLLLEHYTLSRGLVLLTALQVVGFAYFYGCKNLYNDFEFVVGERLSWAWRTVWVVTPVVLLVIEVSSLNILSLQGESSKDPAWQYISGWSLYLLLLLLVLGCACYQVYIQVDYNITQKFLSSIKPSRNWGPVDPIYRHCWVQWRNRYHITGQRDFTLKRRGTRDYTHSVRAATGDSVSHTFETGVRPAATDWSFRRSTASGPYTLDSREHICWRKDTSRDAF